MNRRDSRTGSLLRYGPLTLVVILGVAILVVPLVADYPGWPRAMHLVAGPVVASLGVIALGAVTRSVRWANVVVGATLAGGSALAGGPLPAVVSGAALGAAVSLLSLDPGPVRPSFGGGWRGLLDVDRLARDHRDGATRRVPEEGRR